MRKASSKKEKKKVVKIVVHLGTVSKKKKKKLMEFSIKGPDPASQPLNGKKNKTCSKNALNHLK